MESYNKNLGAPQENKDNKVTSDYSKGRIWAGVVVIVVGGIWLAREAGADIPRWVISPPTFLMALGLFLGARSNFRNWIWLIPFGIGSALLADRIFYWDFNIKPFIWPAAIIAVGLFMIFRPRKKNEEGWIDWRKAGLDSHNTSVTGEEDVIDAVSIFGHTRKSILSKNFRGGEVTNFFGGTDLNLAQADMTSPIVLEMTQVFGGSKLIVPANWRIQSELVSIFGGVDDKRMIQPNIEPGKVLILKGTNIFGGLEIKSF